MVQMSYSNDKLWFKWGIRMIGYGKKYYDGIQSKSKRRFDVYNYHLIVQLIYEIRI